jgi:hypothetical protein
MQKDILYNFDREKNKWLLKERQISFEEVISILDTVGPLDILDHHNKKDYPSQKIYVVEVDGYVYLVPFIKQGNEVFLKTIFPNRKMNKKYLGKKESAYGEEKKTRL